jgi:hypothetical protein
MAKVGAEYMEQQGILNNLAKKYSTTADSIIADMQRASDYQISKADLMQISLAGIAKGLDASQLINLADAAKILGDAVGKDATTALRDLTEALESGRTKGLKTYLGTALDLKSAFGDLESQMTAAEKTQAMYNITMIAAMDLQKRQTGEVSSTADEMERMAANFENAKLAASNFFAAAIGGLYSLVKSREWMSLSEIVEKIYKGAGGKLQDVSVPSVAAPPESKTDQVYKDQIARLKNLLQARSDEKGDKAAAIKAAEEENKLLNEIFAKNYKLEQDWDKAALKAKEEAWKQKLDQAKEFMDQENKIVEMTNRNMIDGIKAMNEAVKTSNEAMILDQKYKQDKSLRQYEEYWAGMMQMANNAGDMSQGLGMFAANMKGMTDIAVGEDPYTKEVERTYNHYLDMRELYWQDFDTRKEVQDAYSGYQLADEQAMAGQRIRIASNTFGMMAGAAKAYYDQSGQQSESAFRMFQAMSIAQTMINTYEMATGAYKAMVGIPYVGPALAIAAAAAATAFGMAQVAAIASQRPGGGVSATGISGGGGYSYNQPTEPSYQKQETVKAGPTIQIYVYGNVVDQDKFSRELVPSILKAVSDGAH